MIVVPLVRKAHGDAVVAKGPDFFDQAVIELAVPLSCQERLDRRAALEKLRAVAPAAVGRIGERDARGVARIPCIFSHARLLRGGLGREGRKRRAAHGGSSSVGGPTSGFSPFHIIVEYGISWNLPSEFWKPKMDRLDAMSVLVAAVEAGSLSAAARGRGMPLATVSRKVSELEAHLKTRLVNRP